MKRNRRYDHPPVGAMIARDLGPCADCGKIRFATRKKALAANQYRSARPGPTKKLRAYRCGNWWHLTSWPAEKMAAWKDYRAS